MEDYGYNRPYNQVEPTQKRSPGFYNQIEPIKKPKKKIWLWMLVPILIIVIAAAFFYFNFSSKTISDSEFSQGVNFQLKENREAKFTLDGQRHTITINSIGSDSVTLTIQSNPIQINMGVGEIKKFDLDDDNFYDIQVKLNKIEEGIPEIYIKKIHESINLINSDDIILDILLPKESYEISEEVSGEYYLKYQGEPFEGAVISCSPNSCSKTVGMIDDIDFNNTEKTNYLKTALTDIFYSNGNYTYSIHIYNCEKIDDEFNTEDCGNGGWPPTIDIEDIISAVSPIKSKSKNIIVTGEESAPKCTNNNDCIQTCSNCESGTYICASSSDPSINQKCVECTSDYNCIEGYECESNICVVEEQEEEPEENQTYPVTDPDTILDCYSENLSEMLCSPEDALEFTTIFETRLGSCGISEGTFALGFEPLMGIFRGYEIQEEKGGNCTVMFWFLENSVIDPSLLNKEMICEYDSSKRTVEDVSACFEECCSGELVDAINAL